MNCLSRFLDERAGSLSVREDLRSREVEPTGSHAKVVLVPRVRTGVAEASNLRRITRLLAAKGLSALDASVRHMDAIGI